MARLNTCEESIERLVRGKRPKRLTGRDQNGTWVGLPRLPRGSSIQTPTGTETPAEPPLFFRNNWVSPMLPTVVVAQPQGRGTEQRVHEVGKSECHPVMGWIGPYKRRYPIRKGADFRLVLTGENSRSVCIVGDVRR